MPETSHDFGPLTPLLSQSADDGNTVNHHLSLRPKTIPTDPSGFQMLHYSLTLKTIRPAGTPLISGASSQPTAPPPILSPCTDHRSTPAHMYTSPGSGASMQVPPLCFDNSPGARPRNQTNRSDYSLSSVSQWSSHTMVSAPLPQASGV